MDEEFAESVRRAWSGGDYAVIAQRLMPISVATVEAAGIGPGDRVLDVATGNANAASLAAHRGAVVTGVDLTPAQIELARTRCAEESIHVDLHVGDAQSLAWPDASFDKVISVMGMIFAPDHVTALAEMARVCRPAGTIAFTAWTHGWFSQWSKRLESILPPLPNGPASAEWGDPAEMERRLVAAGPWASRAVERRDFTWSFASMDEPERVFLSAGPFQAVLGMAASLGREVDVRRELRAAFADNNVATGDGVVLSGPYLLGVARKG